LDLAETPVRSVGMADKSTGAKGAGRQEVGHANLDIRFGSGVRWLTLGKVTSGRPGANV
jgi:hypothetical protein